MRAAAREGTGLACEIGPEGASVAVADCAGEVRLEGGWLAPTFARLAPALSATSLALPLVFVPRRVVMGADAFDTLRTGERSVADLLMWNVFLRLSRREAVRFEAEAPPPDAGRELARRYLWIVRAQMTDGALDGRSAPERLALSLCLGVPFGQTALLRREVRAAAAALRGGTADFHGLRSALLEAMP